MARNQKRRQPAEEEAAGPEILDVEGLCAQWDECEDIRTRLRDGESFIHPEGQGEDVKSCCRNSSLLIPILTRMAAVEGKPVPPVEPLRNEIDKIMTKNKRGNAPEEYDDIVRTSWKLKKLCGFVKMKCRREEVSCVT